MARLASTQRPLRLFSESARWDEAAKTSANWFDQKEQLGRVFDDWTARWGLRPFDALLALQTEYEKMSRSRYAVIAAIVPDMSELVNERDVVVAHLVGTRCALGLVAFHYNSRGGGHPPGVRQGSRGRPLQRHGARAGRTASPGVLRAHPGHERSIRFAREPPAARDERLHAERGVQLPREGGPGPVRALLRRPQRKEWAENVTGVPVRNSIGDLILWPPVMSLYREEQKRTGRLK
jgi:hypothetical protein